MTSMHDIHDKHCLIGLSYFNYEGELLRQSQLCGRVIKADPEDGISIELLAQTNANDANHSNKKTAVFILPPTLSAWFSAPKGLYRDSESGLSIENPDYLVTWDIYQSKPQPSDETQDGVHQWWDWVPRTTPPQVGN